MAKDYNFIKPAPTDINRFYNHLVTAERLLMKNFGWGLISGLDEVKQQLVNIDITNQDSISNVISSLKSLRDDLSGTEGSLNCLYIKEVKPPEIKEASSLIGQSINIINSFLGE